MRGQDFTESNAKTMTIWFGDWHEIVDNARGYLMPIAESTALGAIKKNKRRHALKKTKSDFWQIVAIVLTLIVAGVVVLGTVNFFIWLFQVALQLIVGLVYAV